MRRTLHELRELPGDIVLVCAVLMLLVILAGAEGWLR
jgi:hypothetical protein